MKCIDFSGWLLAFCLLTASLSACSDCSEQTIPEMLIFSEQTDWDEVRDALETAGFEITKQTDSKSHRLSVYNYRHKALGIIGGIFVTPDNRLMDLDIQPISTDPDFAQRYKNSLSQKNIALKERDIEGLYRGICNMDILIYNNTVTLSYKDESWAFGF